jgi:TP901 family phage tail tape measure protein
MASALTATLRADITQFERAIQQAETRITGLQRSTTQVNRELAKFGNDFGGATLIRQANSMAKAVEDIGGVTKLTTAEQKRLGSTVDEALAKYRALGQEVPPALVKVASALDQIRAAEEQAQRGAEALRDVQKRAAAEQVKALQEAARAQQQFAQNLNTIGSGLMRAGAVLTAAVTAPIVAGFGLSIKAAKDFESAFANVVKTVDGLDVDNFGKLNKEAQKLSGEIRTLAKEIPVAATELSSIAAIGGQFGVSRENLVAFTKTVAELGVAVDGISAEEAAAAIAQISKVAGLAEGDFERLASAIVDLGNSGNSTEADILELSKRFAGAGAAAGLSAAEIAGISAAIANVGINAEAGGTAISKTFNEIGAAVARGGKDLEAFAKIAGVSSGEFAKLFKDDAVKAIDKFIGGLRRARDAGQDLTLILDSVGITEARQSDTLRRLAGDYENFSKTVDQSRAAFEKNTALAEEARKKFATFENQLQLFQNRITDIGIELGGPLLQGLRGVLDAADPLVDATAAAARGFASMSDEGKLAVVALGGAVGLAPVMLLVAGQTIQATSSVLEFVKALKGLQAAQGVATGLNATAAATGAVGASTSSLLPLLGKAGLVGLLLAVGTASFAAADAMEDRLAGALDKVGGKAAALGGLIERLQVIQNLMKGPIGGLVGVLGRGAKAGFDVLTSDGGKGQAEADLRALDEQAAALSRTAQAERAVSTARVAGITATAAAVAKLTKEQKDAAESTKKLAAEIDRLTGRDAITRAKELQVTLSKLNINDLDPKHAQEVSKAFDLAIKTADRLGDTVPQIWRDIANATRQPIQATKLFTDGLYQAQPAVKGLGLEMDKQTERMVLGLMNVTGSIDGLGEKFEEQRSSTIEWSDSLGGLSQAFSNLAQVGGDGLDGLIGKIAEMIGLMSAGAQAGKLFADQFRNKDGKGNIIPMGQAGAGFNLSSFKSDSGRYTVASVAAGAAQAAPAAVAAYGALDQATNVKGRGNRAARGAVAGAAIGGQIAGPYGALVGLAVGALVGAFRNPSFEKVYKNVARNFGVELGDETSKAIAKLAKDKFKGSLGAAEIFSLDTIISEGGGLRAPNIEKFTKGLRDAFSFKERGQFSADELQQVLEKNFGAFADFASRSTKIAGKGFAEIAQLAKAAGVEIESINKFVGEQTGRVGGGLADLAGPLLEAAGLSEQMKAAADAQRAAADAVTAARGGKSDEDLGVGDRQAVDAAEKDAAAAAQALADITAKLAAGTQDAQGEFDRLGIIAVGAFNAARASGLGYLEAVDQLSPGLDRMNAIQSQLGLTGNAAFAELSKFRDLVSGNETLVASAEALNDTILGLSNIGGLTVETLAAMEGQGLQTFDRLTAAGFTSGQSIEIMRGFIENLKLAHEQLGVPIDANTQALIDQADAMEGLGPKSPAEALTAGFENVVTAVNRLAKGLGIDVPEAANAAATAVEAATQRSSSAATDAAQVIATKGGESWAEFERKASEAQDGVSEKVREAAERGIGAYRKFAEVAEGSSQDAAETLATYWRGYYGMQDAALRDAEAGFRTLVDTATEEISKIPRDIDIQVNYQSGDFPTPPSGGGGGDVPGLASGGIVRARPGGTIVRVGEGGRDEAVIPLPNGPGESVTIPMLVAALSQIQFTGTFEGQPLLRFVSRGLPGYTRLHAGLQ